jgi:hypothetical protein
MTTKQKIAFVLVVFVTGLAVGRFTLPTRVVTKTEIKTVEKEVIRYKEREQIDKNKTFKETFNKDGSKTIFIVDKSKISKQEDITDQKDKTTDQKTEKTVEYSKTGLLVSVGAAIKVTAPQDGFVYEGRVEKRLLGPVWMGVGVRTDRTVGLSLGLGF